MSENQNFTQRENNQAYLDGLSPHLFWDVDRTKLNANNSKDFIIQRVLEYGLMSDWKSTLTFYGRDEIVNCAISCRYLQTLAMHFVSNVFDVPLSDFRCYSFKQSAQNFWPD